MQPASSGCSVIDLPRSTLSFACLLGENFSAPSSGEGSTLPICH